MIIALMLLEVSVNTERSTFLSDNLGDVLSVGESKLDECVLDASISVEK